MMLHEFRSRHLAELITTNQLLSVSLCTNSITLSIQGQERLARTFVYTILPYMFDVFHKSIICETKTFESNFCQNYVSHFIDHPIIRTANFGKWTTIKETHRCKSIEAIYRISSRQIWLITRIPHTLCTVTGPIVVTWRITHYRH